MNYKDYVGHPLQTKGAEIVSLHGGRGDNMKYIIVRNGIGLTAWISLDRCADLTRVEYHGLNMGYFSPCGHVSSQYYDCNGDGFLKSFTAGFFTTAGLRAVGTPCIDDGETLPLHGTISNTPVESYSIKEEDDGIFINAAVRDCVIFGPKLILQRTYKISYDNNRISVRDTVFNDGDKISPYMILYHCNIGYPLLSEKSVLNIPNSGYISRNKFAEEHKQTALLMEPPQAGYIERCYYFDVKTNNDNIAKAGIYNEDISSGLIISYNKSQLPYFTEWKMMGKKDYVLGLEPGNCTPDGRDVLRKENRLKFLEPEESFVTSVNFDFYSNIKDYEREI